MKQDYQDPLLKESSAMMKIGHWVSHVREKLDIFYMQTHDKRKFRDCEWFSSLFILPYLPSFYKPVLYNLEKIKSISFLMKK